MAAKRGPVRRNRGLSNSNTGLSRTNKKLQEVFNEWAKYSQSQLHVFISYEREPTAKFLQFTTTCFGLTGHHQVVLLPVKEESLHNVEGASIGDEISFPMMLYIGRNYSDMETCISMVDDVQCIVQW
jgi:hypothetical protein